MNEMPSSEFRKRFANLRQATLVTVNGHPIGLWDPTIPPSGLRSPMTDEQAGTVAEAIYSPTFRSRPFTPAPKK